MIRLIHIQTGFLSLMFAACLSSSTASATDDAPAEAAASTQPADEADSDAHRHGDDVDHGKDHGAHHAKEHAHHGKGHGAHHGKGHGAHHGKGHGAHHGKGHGAHHGKGHGAHHGKGHGAHHGKGHGAHHGKGHGAHHGNGHRSHHRRHKRTHSLCRQGNPALPSGPIGTTYESGAFGSVRRLCPRTDVGIQLRAPVAAEIGRELFTDLIGDVPDFVTDALAGREQFYVNAGLGTAVTLSWAPVRRIELFLEIEAFRAQFVRASVTSTAVGFGHLSPGATIVVSEGRKHAIGVTGRVQLPTATGLYKNVFPFGLDAGIQAALKPWQFLRLHGYLGGSGAAALGPVADARSGLVGVAGFEVIPFDWLSFVADLNARGLYDAPVDHLSVAVGVRAAVFSTVGLELAAMAPIVGDERALTAVMMRATWRLGDLSIKRLMSGDVMWNEALFAAPQSQACACGG